MVAKADIPIVKEGTTVIKDIKTVLNYSKPVISGFANVSKIETKELNPIAT